MSAPVRWSGGFAAVSLVREHNGMPPGTVVLMVDGAAQWLVANGVAAWAPLPAWSAIQAAHDAARGLGK